MMAYSLQSSVTGTVLLLLPPSLLYLNRIFSWGRFSGKTQQYTVSPSSLWTATTSWPPSVKTAGLGQPDIPSVALITCDEKYYLLKSPADMKEKFWETKSCEQTFAKTKMTKKVILVIGQKVQQQPITKI